MKKYPHFHENKPTVSENVNFAGNAGYSEEASIFITKKKDLEKRSDIDVEISTDFTITLKT